jgi:hypothetical protein
VFRKEPLTENLYQLSLMVAAGAAVLAAWVGTRLIGEVGGWTATSVRTGLAGAGVLRRNAGLTGEGLLQLFGADVLGQPSHRLVAYAIVHLIGLALVVWALFLAVRRYFAESQLVQVLAMAIAVNVAAYLFTVQAQDITRTREMAAVLPFGAVLAGRLLGPRLARLRLGNLRLVPVMAVVLIGYAGMLLSNAVQPAIQGPPAQLASWLAAHHLTRGLAGYWQASSVTLDTSGSVQVRAVAMNRGRLGGEAYWDGRKSWYDPATQYANYLVSIGPARRWRDQGLVREMVAAAGKPDAIYQSGPYTIAVWHINLLTRLR